MASLSRQLEAEAEAERAATCACLRASVADLERSLRSLAEAQALSMQQTKCAAVLPPCLPPSLPASLPPTLS